MGMDRAALHEVKQRETSLERRSTRTKRWACCACNVCAQQAILQRHRPHVQAV